MSVRPKPGEDWNDRALINNEIAWRKFETPNLTRAVQDFALDVLKSALIGDETETAGVHWVLDIGSLQSTCLLGDMDAVNLEIVELIEDEIGFCEREHVDDSEKYLAAANRFKAWARRLEAAASRQERKLAALNRDR